METHSNSFVIAIKIKQKISKICVSLHDNRQSLYNKWKMSHPDCTLSQAEVIQKLSVKLHALSKSDRVAGCMSQSIKQFVCKIREEWSDQSLQCQLSEIPANSGVKSCFSEVQIIARRQAKDEETQTEEHYILGQNILKESFAVNVEPKVKIQANRYSQTREPVHNKRSATQNARDVSKVKENRKREYPRQKKCNPDIIKACEAIIKKSTQSDMKSMARDFMKEKGYLQEEKVAAIKERRTVFITQQSDQVAGAGKQLHSLSLLNEKHTIGFSNQNNVPSVKKDVPQGKLIVKNRFKYLQSSVLSLAKDYDEKQKSPQKQEARPQKKYTYLDF